MTIDPPLATLREQAGNLFAIETVDVTVDVTVRNVSVRFTRVSDPDRVLDDVCDLESKGVRGLHVPYWAAVWESAAGVVGHLLEHGRLDGRPDGTLDIESSERLNVLDLGCGMGLAGLLMATARPDCTVTLVDYEAHALLLAQINCHAMRDRTSVRLCDWQTDDLAETFDLIVGSDVLYERDQWDFLDRFWKKHLRERGRLVLGEPMRPKADEFAAWSREHGWRVEEFGPRDQEGKRIRVFELQANV